LEKIDFQIHANLPPNEGIFFNGQIFDAWVFVTDLVRTAKQNILLIDNYVDEQVLLLLSKRNKNVTAKIYTQNLTKQFRLDLKKHNSQYPEIEVTKFNNSHDRFLILDNKDVYHIGASLKDLGKKWFAFSKINISAGKILGNLPE
ncbi:MAG: DNA-binding protein, partial [Bacteroidales bacterium]